MDSDSAFSVQPLNRRRLLARFGAAALTTVLSLGVVERAEAARRWCVADPVVMIDGQLADIFLSSDLKLQTAATGPSKIRVYLPSSSKGITILSDLGFGLRGYDIKFLEDASLTRTTRNTQIRISVYVPSNDDDLPLTVTFAPRSLDSTLKEILLGMSADGSVNEWVDLSI